MRYLLRSLAAVPMCALLWAAPAHAQRYTMEVNRLTSRVTLDADNARFEDVVTALFRRFGYSTPEFDLVGASRPVTLHFDRVIEREAFDRVLGTNNASYVLDHGVPVVYNGRRAPDRGVPPGQAIRRSVVLRDATIPEAARYLSDRFGRSVRAAGITTGTRVSLDLRDATLREALDALVRRTDGELAYHEYDRYIEITPVVDRGRPGRGVRRPVVLRDATLQEAARYLTDRFGTSVRVNGYSDARVDLNLRDATLREALDAMVDRSNGELSYREYDRYIEITPTDRSGRIIRRSVALRDATLPEAARYLTERFQRPVRVTGESDLRVSLDMPNATLREVLDALQRRYRELQYREYDRYVEITVERSRRPSEAPEGFTSYVDVSFRDRPIDEVAAELARQGRVRVTVGRDVPSDLRVTVVARHERVWDVLQRIADRSHLRLDVVGGREVILRRGSTDDRDRRGPSDGGERRGLFDRGG